MSRPLALSIIGTVVAGTIALAAFNDESEGTAVIAESEVGEPEARRALATDAALSTPRPTAATAAVSAGSRQAAKAAATTAAPTSWLDAPAADAGACSPAARSVVVDRQWQRGWFCENGAVGEVFPLTSAALQPDPGTYPVYQLDYQSWSTIGGRTSTLDRFVAFTSGKYQGLRIGFHAVPYYSDGTKMQPLDSVGSLARFGESSGCIRVLPEDAEQLYGFLQVGDEVRVIS